MHDKQHFMELDNIVANLHAANNKHGAFVSNHTPSGGGEDCCLFIFHFERTVDHFFARINNSFIENILGEKREKVSIQASKYNKVFSFRPTEICVWVSKLFHAIYPY